MSEFSSILETTMAVETWKAPVRVIRLTGHLDPTTAPELSKSVNRVREEEPLSWAFCLSELEYISSAGIAVLLTLVDRIEAIGGKACFCELHPAVARIFETLNLQAKVSIYPLESEAKSAFPAISA